MIRRLIVVAGIGLGLAACNFAPLPEEDVITPTLEEITLTPFEESVIATATIAPTATVFVEIPTPTPTSPPTSTPEPTATLGPYEHVIRQNETLGFIIQQYGYRDFGVIAEIVRINDNVPNADTLPGEGSVILIPRQTATPTSEAAITEPPAIAGLSNLQPTSQQLGMNIDTDIINYTVLEGDSMVVIAANYATTLEVLARLNPDIPFFGCNFTIPSGGPSCNPPLQVGQQVNVPAPTPTPTLSPTPSGNETPTPTPTYVAPMVISPPDGAEVPARPFLLEWVSVGALERDEVYLVQITDTVTQNTVNSITRTNSLMLPESMVPTSGEAHLINWTVVVAQLTVEGRYAIISGTPIIRTFRWRSR